MFRRELFELFSEGIQQTNDNQTNWNEQLDYDLHPIPDHLVIERLVKWGEQKRMLEIAKMLEMKALLQRNAYFHTTECTISNVVQSSIDFFCASLFYMKSGRKKYAEQMLQLHLPIANQELERVIVDSPRKTWHELMWKEYSSLFSAGTDLNQVINTLHECTKNVTLYEQFDSSMYHDIIWEYYHNVLSFTIYILTDQWISMKERYLERLPLKINLAEIISKIAD